MEGGSSALASTEGAGNKGVACPHVTRRAPPHPPLGLSQQY